MAAASSGLEATLCRSYISSIAPQSDTTEPSKPHSSLRIFCNKVGLAQQGSPLVLLYAPIIEYALPSFTHSLKAGKYVSYKSFSLTSALNS